MGQTTPQVNAVKPTFYILILVSLAHFLNDSIQAVVPALFPFLQKELALSYTELGIISFVLNITSSFLQPALGKMSDVRPRPFLLPVAMVSSGIGLLWIAVAGAYWQLIVAALFIGLGSALFHPEGSKVAYLAAGNQRNFAQSIYQAGGNFGHALAPMFTILIFLPLGMQGAYGLSGIAFVGFIVLALVSKWYSTALITQGTRDRKIVGKKKLSKNVKVALFIIIFITLIRSMYGIGLGSFYQFHLIENYGLSIKSAQLIVFAYLLFGVIGTFWGGKVADKIGKRNLLVLSVSTVIPLGLVLPYAPLFLAVPLLLIIGLVLNSSFSVLVVYAQEMMPGQVATVSGLIIGLAFGLGAISAVALGKMADLWGIDTLMTITSFIFILALVSFKLPNDKTRDLSTL